MALMRFAGFWRICIVGVVLLAALGKAGDCIGCRVGNSLRAFRQDFRALEDAGVSLNSMDRLILRLILSESKNSSQNKKDVRRG